MTIAFKDTNPKDAVGIKKWRYISTVPLTVLWELGAAMLEGARKYGRHNYRVAGVRASVYVDAAFGHIGQWWEGEDIDQDSGLSHITKAIASLVVLRDAMIQDMLVDDRPPRSKLSEVRGNLQSIVDRIFTDHPEARPPFTEADHGLRTVQGTGDDIYLDHVNVDGTVTKVRIDPNEPIVAQVREIVSAADARIDDRDALKAYIRVKMDSGRLEKASVERVLKEFGLGSIGDACPDQVRPLFAAIQTAERHDQ